MDELLSAAPALRESHSPDLGCRPVSGSYQGQNGLKLLELRIDLDEGVQHLYQPLDIVSGDFFRDAGSRERDYLYSFIVDHAYTRWETERVVVIGEMIYYRNAGLPYPGSDAHARHILKVTIPLSTIRETPSPATVQVIRWGQNRTTYLCQKKSAFLRTVDLEIDQISGTELPRSFQTHTVIERPPDLPILEMGIAEAYRRAGIDMRLIGDGEVLPPVEAGSDLKWDEDELHHAMEHHFSRWRDEPQWKLYLLIATHYRLYPERMVTGIMYDNIYRDPNDPCPRQGVAAFNASMTASWRDLSPGEFDRNYLRTCVHELGHALNLLHSFDRGCPDSSSWMNYPWRYPYGYNLPSGWDGTSEFWRSFRFEFDAEELRHLRHHALMEVIPGGTGFGASSYDLAMPVAVAPRNQQNAPIALYVRTRPERYLFDLAEPVRVELKLKNQSDAPITVPDMLNPEFGLLELFIRDPKGRARPYRPLFRLCGEARMVELPPGEKLYESVFVAYGAEGFYFEEPGEYQLWAVYGAGEQRVRSNVLRLRVAFPQNQKDEEMALWTFGRDQGHILYMRGAEHLRIGNDQLREVTERFPGTNLARYIHYCFGLNQARSFKDAVQGKVREPRPEAAIRELERARAFLSPGERHSSLDNITHGQTVDLLSDLYYRTEQPKEAKSVLSQTARYFTRMNVKPAVIEEIRSRAAAIEA